MDHSIFRLFHITKFIDGSYSLPMLSSLAPSRIMLAEWPTPRGFGLWGTLSRPLHTLGLLPVHGTVDYR